MPGEFAKLLPFKWRDVEVPVTNVRFSLAHDLVEHKYWGIDGARVEATGVAPIRISATIPILNTIVPGEAESWSAGGLYPTALRRLFIEFGRKTTGLLQHPEFGRLACKPERIECVLEGARQDHAQVEASWVETQDDNVKAVPRLNPVQDLAQAAFDLDASDEDLRALAPKIPVYEDTFEDLANSVAAVGDQIALLQQRSAGRIDAIVYRAQTVQQSIDRARHAGTWAATQSIERMKAAAYRLREQLLAANRDIGLYAVPRDTTLAGVAAQLPRNTGMSDVIKLNPRLVRYPIIHAGTPVRYYLAA